MGGGGGYIWVRVRSLGFVGRGDRGQLAAVVKPSRLLVRLWLRNLGRGPKQTVLNSDRLEELPKATLLCALRATHVA